MEIFRSFPKHADMARFTHVVYIFEDHVYGKEVISIQNFHMEKA
ncbi:hypothetical protein [Bacteroidetes bacterium endosymbiont of Geopemphigus sp.]|nr:hypothetical protein [Bacteroidetes bacterium endosymbiont of Geopemphigus sp.]